MFKKIHSELTHVANKKAQIIPNKFHRGKTLEEDDPQYKSVMQKASFWNFIHFGFSFKTMHLANVLKSKGKSLNEEVLPGLDYNERAEILERKFLAALADQKKKNKKLDLGWAILKVYRSFLAFIVFLQTSFIFLRIFSVWIMKRLLDSLSDPDTPASDALKWAGIMCALLIVSLYIEHHYFYLSTLAPIHIRAGLVSMIYNKVTRVSLYSLNEISLGKIVNIVANDVNVFERTGYFFTSTITGILALIGSSSMLWILFGPSCLVGIGCVVMSLPLQQVIAKLALNPRDQKNRITDERVKLTNEIIEGIRLIKMYTWELVFGDAVKALRKKEIGLLKKVLSYEGSSRGIASSTQCVCSFIIFLTFVLTGGELRVSAVFPTLFLVGYLKVHAVSSLANALLFISEAGLLFSRILKIMETPEISNKPFMKPKDPKNAIEFEDFGANWSKEDSEPLTVAPSSPTEALKFELNGIGKESKQTLSDINVKIKKGSLNALIGKVGSGKTSLLLSFTGEMPQIFGNLRYEGKLAYVEQEPSIFAGTVRDNITFGKSYKPEFYNKVVENCCLENDFKNLSNGDLTEIGEKGINLSGGQKARIALARAIFADADIYLLDDPLSAVDAKVAQKIFQQAICGMLREKTVILATHQVHFVKSLENIIVIEQGRIVGIGDYEKLKLQGVDTASLFSSYKRTTAKSLQSDNLDEGSASEIQQPATTTSVTIPGITIAATNIVETINNSEDENKEIEEKSQLENEEKGKLFSSEDKYGGAVNLKTYGNYILNMGPKLLLFVALLVFSGNELANIAYGRVLGIWADGTFDQSSSLVTMFFITILITALYIGKNIMFNIMTLKASEKIHNKMTEKIVRAPVEFFDTNPVGRILNRFSNDIGILDRAISSDLADVIEVALTFITNIITVAIISPFTLVPIVIASLGIGLVVKFSYESMKQCRNYDLASRSPMYSLFSSTLSGLIVIKSYGQEKNFALRFRKMINNNTKGNIAFKMCSRCFGFYVDYLYNLSAISSILIITALKNTNSGLFGLSLTYILGIAGMLQLGLRQVVQINVQMASVSRIQAYCDIQSEAELTQPNDEIYEKAGWPIEGKISFHSVYMKYRKTTDHVVRDLSFEAQPGEKIGCIGRTGAGKSSIIQTLFRMIEIDPQDDNIDTNCVKIDGVNTRTMGLHLLRNSLSIIPQTPFIFSGTVKRNLDPLGKYKDEELWSALEDVGLKETVEKMEQKLDTDMSNVSSVFSVGQKQLICLARAILKKSKVLVLDEATANVDLQTDAFIQTKIMEKFSDCTLFTIAHRLSTIAHYDKILVLDHGKKVEFDAPYILLVKNIGDDNITNIEGHFASMVLNTGPKASLQIFNIAKETYFNKMITI